MFIKKKRNSDGVIRLPVEASKAVGENVEIAFIDLCVLVYPEGEPIENIEKSVQLLTQAIRQQRDREAVVSVR